MKTYTAKSIEELLSDVSKEKNVPVDQLSYFITEEKKGILGLGNSVTAEVYCLDDVKEFIFEYLGEFFTSLNQDIEIEITQQADGFNVMLNAENNARLIGYKGQTVAAINTVTKGAVNAYFKRRFNILIDINNYKHDRYSHLKAMAVRIAKTVQKTKVDAVLDPMPNDERKVIHQILSEMPNIKTQSEGEGRARHLKVLYVADNDTGNNDQQG